MTPSHFQNRFPLVHVVLDGWGIGKDDEHNAISKATLPTLKHLMDTCPSTQLNAHGPFVGLPSSKDLGGSEVGHMTMGAGKILEQGPSEIKRLVASGEFFESPVLQKLTKQCLEHQTPLHLLGLLSDGNIHSHIDHFRCLIEHAFQSGIKQLYVHALLDGRDVPIQSATTYIDELETLFATLKDQDSTIDYAFASGGGREKITMDRDEDWSKIEAGWNVHVRGKADHYFETMTQAVQHFREETPDLIDQAIPGFVLMRDGKPVAPIRDHHSVIFVNFRGDRAVQMSQAFVEDEWSHFDRSPRPNIEFAGMKIYDQDANIPSQYILGPTKVEDPFGKRILDKGFEQFRLAETQKYAHVTFFYNGGYREPLDPTKESYHLIESDQIPSFDLKPEMKAFEIAQKAVSLITAKQHHYGLINFANADMVGHSGSMDATIKAVQTVDQALGLIVAAVKEVSGLLVVTADHGNADQMAVFNSKTELWEPNTKHTLNPVPFIIYDPLYDGSYHLKQPDDDPEMNLSNIAATNFMLMGMPAPSDVNDPLFVL